MDDLKARHGALPWLAKLDMTDMAALRHVVDQAFAEPGRIEVAVGNAGQAASGRPRKWPTRRSSTRSTPI